MHATDLTPFLQQHRLPGDYAGLVDRWFAGLADDIAMHQKRAAGPIVVGINGAQGSGKSTLAALLVYLLQSHHGITALALSLDDFYLRRDQRRQLAAGVHPLLAYRGVPGTHDVDLACSTLTALKRGQCPVALPRFDKACDDRRPQDEMVEQQVDVIVIEGWCLGALPQSEAALAVPINELEAREDADGRWRHHVNAQLAHPYPSLFALIDCWVMLRAPSFACVLQWRARQERELWRVTRQADAVGLMDPDALTRFVSLFQRVTEHCLATLPQRVDYLYELDADRRIHALHVSPRAWRPRQRQWLVFTDLDGSLLDHHSYRFDAAMPVLQALEQALVPLIPVSSKTLAELELLRPDLNNHHPFIIENGAAVCIPTGYFARQPPDTRGQDGYWIREFVAPRQHWQSLIAQAKPGYEGEFLTFAEAGIDGIMAMTGLNVHAAARAARRQYGEPVCWQGNGNKRQAFIADLQRLGATVLQGGRFLHVSGDCDKGRALAWLADIYRLAWLERDIVTLAIGDSDNDLAMLERADKALLIRSPVHAPPAINRRDGLHISRRTGPEGWAEGVTAIINPPAITPPNDRGHHG